MKKTRRKCKRGEGESHQLLPTRKPSAFIPRSRARRTSSCRVLPLLLPEQLLPVTTALFRTRKKTPATKEVTNDKVCDEYQLRHLQWAATERAKETRDVLGQRHGRNESIRTLTKVHQVNALVILQHSKSRNLHRSSAGSET